MEGPVQNTVMQRRCRPNWCDRSTTAVPVMPMLTPMALRTAPAGSPAMVASRKPPTTAIAPPWTMPYRALATTIHCWRVTHTRIRSASTFGSAIRRGEDVDAERGDPSVVLHEHSVGRWWPHSAKALAREPPSFYTRVSAAPMARK